MHGPRRCYGELVELTVDDIGRSQMLATRNFGDWHAIIGEVTWSSVVKTMIDCHRKLVLHSLRNNMQPVQVVMHQPRAETDHAHISRSLWPDVLQL